MKAQIYKIFFWITLLLNFQTTVYSQNCPKIGTYVEDHPCNFGDYVLVFEDNFNGNSLDETKWFIPYQGVIRGFDFSISKEWWANTGSTPSIPMSNNIEVSNGTLKIIAKREIPPIIGTYVTNWDPPITYETNSFDYSSANIESHAKFKYGKYEIRCRLPNGKGFFPAFWTFGGPGWNEIDIFDNIEGNSEFACGPVYDYDGDGEPEQCRWSTNSVPDFSQWHIFTCIYAEDRIVWLIDNNPVRTLWLYRTIDNNWFVPCQPDIADGSYLREKSFPVMPMRIIMDLAIRSGSKSPDASTVFPNYYEVDYVKFYAKEECCSDIVINSTSDLNLNPNPEFLNYICGKSIIIGNSVVLPTGYSLVVRATETLTINPGFTAEAGSYFETQLSSYNGCCPINNPIFPNVFTPNGDGCNDQLCFKDVIGATSYEVVVVKLPWNTPVYSGSGIVPQNPTYYIDCNGNNSYYSVCVWDGAGACHDCNYAVGVTFRNECGDELLLGQTVKTYTGNNRIALADTIVEINDELFNFDIFPNPTKDHYTIRFSDFLIESTTLEIASNSGVVIFKQNINNLIELQFNNKLPPGVYFVKVTNNIGNLIKKLVIMN